MNTVATDTGIVAACGTCRFASPAQRPGEPCRRCKADAVVALTADELDDRLRNRDITLCPACREHHSR